MVVPAAARRACSHTEPARRRQRVASTAVSCHSVSCATAHKISIDPVRRAVPLPAIAELLVNRITLSTQGVDVQKFESMQQLRTALRMRKNGFHFIFH